MSDQNLEQKTILLRESVEEDDPFTIAVHVTRMVVAVSDREITDLEPLYHCIDGDALDALTHSDSRVNVKFPYEGYQVEIQYNEPIEIFILET